MVEAFAARRAGSVGAVVNGGVRIAVHRVMADRATCRHAGVRTVVSLVKLAATSGITSPAFLQYRVAYADIEPRHFIGIVQCGSADCTAATHRRRCATA